jgi:hypothetical protein
MIHGPCGNDNERMQAKRCMQMGRDRRGNVGLICSKHYPKEFCDESILCHPQTKMPQYKRRNDGRFVYRENIRLGNNWVVPYSPYLTLRYNCHINVELCSSYQCVKYLFKYVYKGQDCADVVLSVSEVQPPGEVAIGVPNGNNGASSQPAQQRVLNYDEIKTYLSKNPYNVCLSSLKNKFSIL